MAFHMESKEPVAAVKTWHVKADGLLTPPELAQYPEEATAGILEELTMWGVAYTVMVAVHRYLGMRPMASTYVPKWKRITRTDGTTA